MESLFRTIGSFYLKEKYIESITDVRFLQFSRPENFMDLKDLDLGPLVKTEMAALHPNTPPANLTWLF